MDEIDIHEFSEDAFRLVGEAQALFEHILIREELKTGYLKMRVKKWLEEERSLYYKTTEIRENENDRD